MKNEKGIGLLALIITMIIVMILVAATILFVIEGDIFNYLNEVETQQTEEGTTEIDVNLEGEETQENETEE